MSVFSEFHKAWRARFPGHDLPAAWEEDVRANLAKHRARVAVLKEELEKEQFYVEYLECLLSDVQRQTDGPEERGQGEGSEGAAPGVVCPGLDSAVTEAINTMMVQRQGGSDPPRPLHHPPLKPDAAAKPAAALSDEEEAPLAPITPLAAPPPSGGSSVRDLARRFTASGGRPSAAVGRPPAYSRSTSVPSTGVAAAKESQFVTVISVNGSGHGEDGRGRKVPPAPPPKTFRRSTGADGDIEAKVTASPPSPGVSRPPQALPRSPQRPRHPSPVREPPAKAPLQKTLSASSDGRPATRDAHKPPQASSVKDLYKSGSSASSTSSGGNKSVSKSSSSASSCGGGSSRRAGLRKTSSLSSSRGAEDEEETGGGSASGASLENLTDDEPLYDTVAPDEDDDAGEYVLLSDKSSEYNGTDTLKSAASGASSEGGLSKSGGGASSGATPSGGSPAPDHPPDSPKYSNYVNIDFFLKKKKGRSAHQVLRCESVDTDEEEEEEDEEEEDEEEGPPSLSSDHEDDVEGREEVQDIDSGVYGSSVESTSQMPSAPSTPPTAARWVAAHDSAPAAASSARPAAPPPPDPAVEAERLTMYRCIISSIVESETNYLECLDVVLKYMKALKTTLKTSQPVISPDDFSTVFYRITDLQAAHSEFLAGLKQRTASFDGSCLIGELFRRLASKLDIYATFLQNYPRAVETVRRCSSHSVQFADITRSIKLPSLQGQAQSLEDLLHRPVARVQKNALVLHDLLKYTPEQHPDQEMLREALQLTQTFLTHLSVLHTEAMFPQVQERPQRHLVRNSFIVELVEGHRKLRHLFLFNDVIVCAKYKPTGRSEKFTFEVKWFISLHDIVVIGEGGPETLRESNPPNLVHLKSQASTVRDHLRRNDSSDKVAIRLNMGRNEKHRKKLAELEAQLVLASPNLPFRIGKCQGPVHTFLISSEYERDQWGEAIQVLQANTPGVGGSSLTLQELQSWITACRSFLKTNMGSFLLKSGRDDSLLLGDLHIVVTSLHGLTSPANMYVCFEVDSYGHFFRKAKTKTVEGIEPRWNQDFIIELEGSQTLRILCYEDHPKLGLQLRGKTQLELSRSWLTDSLSERRVCLQDLVLVLSLKFLLPEATLRRVPTGKSSGLFCAPIQTVCNREKRSVPFIVTRCVREVERRGIQEVGIYRVSGLASDITRLKKSFESNPYEAEQLIKEVDIHSVTGLLKLFLRELPEALYTSELYPRFFEAYSASDGEYQRTTLLKLFSSLPQLNQSIIAYLLEHLIKIHEMEHLNKMSLHNLATVFGPTLLRPAACTGNPTPAEKLAAGTMDVMAQAGILHFFLKRRANGEPIQVVGQ